MRGHAAVQTVCGPVPSEQLGTVLPHEHLISDSSRPPDQIPDTALWRHYDEPIRLDNYYNIRRDHVNRVDQRMIDVSDAIAEVGLFRAAGGSTIVELTPPELGRDPVALREIAKATGVNIVMGCGHYVAAYHPPGLAEASTEDLTAELVTELRDGVAGTGIRPGVIGEIGISWPPAPVEVRSLRAAARAQAETGVALVIHPGRDPRAPLHHLDIVADAGGDPTRCVMSHVDRTLFTGAEVLALARTGCYVEFDLFGIETSHYALTDVDLPNDAMRVDQVGELFAAGYGRQVLVSHDICNRSRMSRYGGEGYTHLLTRVVPMMRRKGFDDHQLAIIFVDNPAAMLRTA